MTPRLHGIHHEANEARTNSNWSSGFALWDLLHGTQLWDTNTGRIGVPAYQDEEDVKLTHCLALPFKQQRADWVSEAAQGS
jgi:sterol desaturase/sphingolipid hydroxylase (fatty acid hydroxylase superfamily)